MHTQLKADLMLVLVTFFWGISYLLTDLALTEVGVFSLNAIRFLLAFVVGGLCFLPRLRHPSAATLKTALATGAALFCVYTATTFGVKYTSLSNAGFLCALPVVFTPLLDFQKAGDPGNNIVPIGFDVTKLARQWYAAPSSKNYGIIVRSRQESDTALANKAYVTFLSSDYPGAPSDVFPSGVFSCHRKCSYDMKMLREDALRRQGIISLKRSAADGESRKRDSILSQCKWTGRLSELPRTECRACGDRIHQ